MQAGAFPLDGDRGASADVQGRRAGASVLLPDTVSNNVSPGEEGCGGGSVTKREGIGNVLVSSSDRTSIVIGVSRSTSYLGQCNMHCNDAAIRYDMLCYDMRYGIARSICWRTPAVLYCCCMTT